MANPCLGLATSDLMFTVAPGMRLCAPALLSVLCNRTLQVL